MKYLKYFENNNHEELVTKLINKILSDNKTINNFTAYYDNMTGTMGWSYDKYEILATPYWEDEYKLPINIMLDGEDIDTELSKDLPKMNNVEDIDKVLKLYYSIISDYTEKLNKRLLFNSILPKILNLDLDVEIIIDEISYYINSIVDYDLNNDLLIIATPWTNSKTLNMNEIKTDDIIKILNKINEEYPYIIKGIKYNI